MTKEDEKFLNTTQEKVKLVIALKRFFQLHKGEEMKDGYGEYLKRRIRPAMEQLIREEDLEKLQSLWELGWIQEEQLAFGLITARRQGKLQAHAWLIRKKSERYAFTDKNFSL